ncbi:glycogen/starch synthase, partial [Amycolatopsis sp. NPDC059020]|uniref:glycogen/starch synthase n=1 Tax=Amycolatopsis sp. NPDC059020 TaxID=3346703 RepID=UPI003670668D
MRVLMLSWEYPPVVVGGLARHVHALARHLARQGHEVVVLCRHTAGTDAETHPRTDRVVEGVRIIRVAEDPMHVTFERDLVAWTLAMGHAMIRAAHDLLRGWQPDVVHAGLFTRATTRRTANSVFASSETTRFALSSPVA